MILKKISLAQALLLAAWLGAIVMMLRAVWIQGVGYDAAFELEAYLTIRDMGEVSSLAQAYEVAPITSEFYGLLTFQIADVITPIFGIELSPDSPAAYLVHHYVVAALAIATSAVVALGIAVALRSLTAGLFASALLLVTPLWMGLGTMDYKDVPVAAGLTTVSAALIYSWRGRQYVFPGVMAALGGFLALGTRAGSLLLILALVLGSTVLFAIAALVRRAPIRISPVAITSLASVSGALLGLWVTNPFARLDFPTWLFDSYVISREYIWVGVIRTAGMDLQSDQLPWWYAPAWLLAQLPILTTCLIAVTLIIAIYTAVRPTSRINRGDLLAMSPFAIQGLLLPAAIIGTGAVLYDGIRHLLFALPGLIALSALPYAWLERDKPTRIPQRLGFVFLGSVVVMSLFASIRWFPYSYAFINPIAGADKSERDWELDYWGLTSREGIERLSGPGQPAVAVVPAAEPGRPFGGVTAEVADAETAATGVPHGVYVFRRWDAQFRQDWCTRTFTIERDGHILGEGGTCP